MTVIDGTGAILGRLSTNVAKRLRKREVIHILNAEKIVITGKESGIMGKFKTRLEISPKGNPHKGPKYSRMPDKIVKFAIRGMLPWKTPSGKTAFKNLRVYIGTPEQFATEKVQKIEEAQIASGKMYLTIEQIAKNLGAKW
ncbi:MAG TPA: 50S ribosomal protein L13 [archaeon]|nr:50S ribosomal protein L13 [archaeon]